MLGSALLLGIPMISCDNDNKSEEPDTPDSTTLTMSATELQFNANGDEQQTVIIQTNGNWSVRTDADWIEISPRSGTLNGSITISVNSPNETTREREDNVYVTAGEREELICVKQQAMLQANCNVTPKTLVILAKGVALDVEFDTNVNYFQMIAMETSQVNRMTDTELVAILDEQNRFNATANESYSSNGYYDPTSKNWQYMTPETDYTILTVGHDNKGNRGDLIKTQLKTKSDKNQPIAWIYGLNWDNDSENWSWKTEIDSLVKQYYQLKVSTTSDSELFKWSDMAAAFSINKYLSEEPGKYTPAFENGSWTWTPSKKPYFIVYTWAQDQNGEWSGCLFYDYGIIPGYTSSPKKTSKNTVKTLKFEQHKILKDIDFEITRLK